MRPAVRYPLTYVVARAFLAVFSALTGWGIIALLLAACGSATAPDQPTGYTLIAVDGHPLPALVIIGNGNGLTVDAIAGHFAVASSGRYDGAILYQQRTFTVVDTTYIVALHGTVAGAIVRGDTLRLNDGGTVYTLTLTR